MGTYAAWRAAIQVFIYPENFLLPSLRAGVSPVLSSIFDQTRGSVDLTPDQARQLAAGYIAYLRDVITLQLQASCTAYTGGELLGDPARCDRPAPHLSFRCQREPVRVLGGV